MRQLHPTLWRTCRTLANPTRLRLLQLLLERPGSNVSQLAERLDLGISAASQELRRLQSRGLIKRTIQGPSVIYLPVPDPQVPSAAPLLKALQAAWEADRNGSEAIARLAKGLACERRISLVRALVPQPQPSDQWAHLVRTRSDNLKKHVRILRESGWVTKIDKRFALLPAGHPVQATLLKLL